MCTCMLCMIIITKLWWVWRLLDYRNPAGWSNIATVFFIVHTYPAWVKKVSGESRKWTDWGFCQNVTYHEPSRVIKCTFNCDNKLCSTSLFCSYFLVNVYECEFFHLAFVLISKVVEPHRNPVHHLDNGIQNYYTSAMMAMLWLANTGSHDS